MDAEVAFSGEIEALWKTMEQGSCDEETQVEAFSELAEELLTDTPKLATIMKNYVATVVGQSLVNDEVVKLDHATTMAREVLKALTLLDLPPAPEWGSLESNKQGPEQSGLDRVNQLSRYKVARMLHSRVIKTKAKISNTFGLKFLICTRSWITLKNLCESKLPKGVDEELWRSLFDNFELALRAVELGSDDPTLFQVDLIFANDFSSALSVRNVKRREEVVKDI